MMSTAQALTQAGAAPAAVVYEQPLTERMRTFLRIEYLYQQLMFHSAEPSAWGSRAVVGGMLDIVTILNRGDVRTDVLKELERQLSVFDRYQNVPSVDDSRLKGVLRNLRRLKEELVAVGSQYLQPLRESEFLSAVKHRSAIPGGACEFDLPEYGHWLRRSFDARRADIEHWMSTMRPICDGIAELLWLIRESTPPVQQVASNGVYHHVFNKETGAGLLRISLPPGTLMYPEISGSHHRFTMRFMQWSNAQSRPVQVTRDVRFDLTIC
jgi:cell division protein ZapD